VGFLYFILKMDLMQQELEQEFWEQLKYLFNAGKIVPDKYYEDLFNEHIDKKFMVIDSHNWLSKIGIRKGSKDEKSCIVSHNTPRFGNNTKST
jgi:hypothetical protein